MSLADKPQPDSAISPSQLQRAIFIAVLSFLFFLAMMFAYYIRQSALYFLLATAFLLVYIMTMISFVRLRRAESKRPQ
jgi:membrane protein YdbS with pleckstrin-like domain